MKIIFEIIERNIIRSMRTDHFTKVRVLEEGETIDVLWMSETDIQENKKAFGKDSFIEKTKEV